MREPSDGDGIYDPRLMERCLKILGQNTGNVIDEAVLGDWLDQVYGSDLALEWTGIVAKHRDEFERSCIRPLRAFEGDDTLEEEFDRLFDGAEVLPASMVPEFRSLSETSVIEAQSLLVPTSYRQLRRLGTAARWDRDLRVHVVDIGYDPQLGLLLPTGSRSAQ